jgi:hypothetical protein
MYFSMSTALALSLAAAPSPESPDIASVESAFHKSQGAKIDSLTAVKFERYEIPGLFKKLGANAYVARLLDPDGNLLDEVPFLFRDGDVRSLGIAYGGWGLMSAVVYGNCLYYTYSWGSGIHRSHIGRVSLHPGELRLRESIGYQNVDLFVKVENRGVAIYEGEFISFNNWRGKSFLQGVDDLFTDAKVCGDYP